MPFNWRIQAEYESGFVLTEDEFDHSPYEPGRNIFRAILEGHPTQAGHGPMVRFSLIPDPVDGRDRYDVDWAKLTAELDDPRPIYFRRMTRNLSTDPDGNTLGDSGPVCQVHVFGWQAIDQDGQNCQETTEVRP